MPCIDDELGFEIGEEQIIAKTSSASVNSLWSLGGFKIELGVKFGTRTRDRCIVAV